MDACENVNRILKDEVAFMKSELEQTNKFREERGRDVDFLEADMRAQDLERKFTQQLNDKDRSAEKSLHKESYELTKSRDSVTYSHDPKGKGFKPIVEEDEYIDPRNMDKVKAVSFNNPLKESSE